MKKLKERFKIWIVHKCGGKFPYEYAYDKKMNVVHMERPFVHLKHSMLIDYHQYEENPDYAVDITEAELARNLGEAMRNQGYINYSYELLHYGYNVTADVYVAKGEERVNKEMVRK